MRRILQPVGRGPTGTRLAPEEALQRIPRQRALAAQLTSLVAKHLPLTVKTNAEHDDWGVTAPAFVVRASRIVDAILSLDDVHEAAAGVLVRVLYEHVVTFAWIAIDPPTNILRWVRYDRQQRLKADDEATRLGRPLLNAARRREIEGERDRIMSSRPALPEMAMQADEHWAAKLDGFSSERYSLRGLYLVVYRQFSPLIHGMPESLTRVVSPGPDRGLCVVGAGERIIPQSNAFTATPMIYALGLLVSGAVLGFPMREEVEEVFESFIDLA